MRRHQQLPSLTGDHFTAAATTTPAPPTTSLQRQLPLLHQWPLPCRSRFQFCTSSCLSCTSDHFLHHQTPAATFLHPQTPATNSPEPATNFLHQQIPATTSSGPANTFLHQQIPVLNQRPPIQRIPILYQLSRPTPATRSCSNDHHPAAAIVRRTLFFDLRFTIIKFGLSKKTLVLSFLPSSLSITYISRVCGDRYTYLASATYLIFKK